MSEKMTPERVLHKLLACGQKEEMKAVLALIAERDQLEAMVDGFWWYLDQAYNIESREELEVIAEGWEPSNPMQVAIHHIWKREPKVVELDAKLVAAEERMAAMEGALREIRQAIFDAGDDPVARIGAFDQITAALDGTTTSQKGEDHDQEV